MKKILVLLVPVFLSGCVSEKTRNTIDSIERSEVVKVCSDGTLVGYDPELQQYNISKGISIGMVSKEVELENICQKAN